MLRRAFLVVSLVLALTACGKQRVVTQPDSPPLAPPSPPPRVVTPPEVGEPQPPAQPAEPERKPVRRVPPRTETGRETPKVEPPKPQTPAKPDTPVTREETQPPTTLQTAQPATQADMERQARALLGQATQDLKGVNYKGLNADAKGQYDTAKRFVEQAQQALKQQNPVLALRLAEKAATIAGVLVGK